MDKMLVLLPEDKKPRFFFRGLFMDRILADIWAHLLSEYVSVNASASWQIVDNVDAASLRE